MRLSVVVPVLDEAQAIDACLARLQPLRVRGHEVIVADGGSRDDTVARAMAAADVVTTCRAGRAAQQNAGAGLASGDVLLFLHVDCALPASADDRIGESVARGSLWGRFDVRLSGDHPLLRVVERMMNLRSRWTGIATGDQAIFVERNTFARVGGFPDIALMEDIELSSRLRRLAPPACLGARVVASSRRWERFGVMRTILLMWRLRLAHYLGADPERLAARYRAG